MNRLMLTNLGKRMKVELYSQEENNRLPFDNNPIIKKT